MNRELEMFGGLLVLSKVCMQTLIDNHLANIKGRMDAINILMWNFFWSQDPHSTVFL